MSRPERDKILEHDFDGIREYDNPLPGWWLLIFYVSIVWAAAYFAWYHLGPGLSNEEAHSRAVRDAARVAAGRAIASGETTDDTFAAVARHDLMMAHASAVYATKCSGCHGDQGQGAAGGPNLTDEYWLHGGGMPDMFRVLKEGLPHPSHPAGPLWLRQDELWSLTAHVATFRGTHPPNPKGPEGVVWTPGGGAGSGQDAVLVAYAKDAAHVAAGKELYATRCTPCHGASGEGLIGPNLTDDYTIHGWRLSDIYTTISEGVVAKGMLSWKSQLSTDQMRQLAGYVATLRGTTPPNPRPPQGDLAQGHPLAELPAAP